MRRKTMLALAIVMFCVILAAIGQVSMKQGMNDVGSEGIGKLLNIKGFLKIFTNKYVFIGISVYVVGLILWLLALSKLDVSLMYPLVSLGYILTAIFAFVFLKENVTLMRWAGIFLIIIGSFLIIKTG